MRIAKLLAGILLSAVACLAIADELLVYRLADGRYLAVSTGQSGLKIIGTYDTATVESPSPPMPPQPPVVVDEPIGPGQLICVRPWSCTLDESDAILTIRESLDAVQSKVPYFVLLPGTPDQNLQPHPAERYRGLVNDQGKSWIFHVVPTKTTPRILHQGLVNADTALGWVGVKKVAFAAVPENANEAQWLDVDFSQQVGEQLGALELPPLFRAAALAAAANVRTLPGFQPIPKSEWPAWVARFPPSRFAKTIRNITEQTMGSCVGHCCANDVEAGEYMMAGDPFFRRISGMSMYVRIGRSPSSGAYIPDACDEVFARGILPVTGQSYPHEFAQDTGFSTKLPTGWENTARFWKAVVYSVDDQEAGFRVGMDWRLRRQIGRSSHSISAGGYTGKSWWYENSWGTDWGDFGVSMGYDSSFYSGYVKQPVLRDEVPVLLARELPALRAGPQRTSALQSAADDFHAKIREIMRQAEAASKKE